MVELLLTAFNQLIAFLEKLEKDYKTNYYLVGGILANIYTVFRVTQDIDFVLDIQSHNVSIEQYISLLEQNKFFPLQDWNTTTIMARENNLLQFFDKQEVVKFDNYLIDKYDQSRFKKIGPLGLKRRVREKLFDIECWVASKEDFILSKLVYGGWQDYSDALGCWMRFNKSLDLPYMNKISMQLGVQKELDLLKSGIDDPDEYFETINGY